MSTNEKKKSRKIYKSESSMEAIFAILMLTLIAFIMSRRKKKWYREFYRQYRGYQIMPGRDKKFRFIHVGYSGDPDDPRIGGGDSIEECMWKIDEIEEDRIISLMKGEDNVC
jgi:hypothetical protein